MMALNSYYRLKPYLVMGWSGEYKNKTYSTSHMKYWGDLYGKIGITSENIDRMLYTPASNAFQVNEQSFNRSYNPVPSELNIYTDGSKTESGTGSGFIFYKFNVPSLEGSASLSDFNTVFQAELLAIKLAAENVSRFPDVKYVRFYVDSRAALMALRSSNFNSKLVHETAKALNTAAEGRSIILNWIKAHAGKRGNEEADRLAKEGCSSENGVEVGLPWSALKNKIVSQIYEMWEREWNEYDGARMSKQFIPGPDSNKAKYLLKLSRAELGRILRLLSGHNGLFYFKHKVDNEICPTCRFCGEEDETFYHLATKCPCFSTTQRDIFLDKYPIINTDWNVRDVLRFSYVPAIDDAIGGDTRLPLFGYTEEDDLGAEEEAENSPDE